ncbi:MAG: hypothetical protein AAB443_03115 [Patescibacteria group bacterium]
MGTEIDPKLILLGIWLLYCVVVWVVIGYMLLGLGKFPAYAYGHSSNGPDWFFVSLFWLFSPVVVILAIFGFLTLVDDAQGTQSE